MLLVIEDDAPIRRALRHSLGDLVDRVVEAESGQHGLALAGTERPVLVILDLGLPDIDGGEICRSLRQITGVPIVILSARHSEREKVRLLDLGADDYVTKPFSTDELVARVRAHLRRSGPAADETPVIRSGRVAIDSSARRVTVDDAAVHLTPIEYDLLVTLAADAGRTLTHRQLFDRVWRRSYGNPQHHLRVHLTNLRRKIEVDPTAPQLIVTEPGVGYRFEILR